MLGPRPVSPSTDRLGFTLAEVLLALTILASAAVVIVSVTGAGLRATGDARDRALAVAAARHRLETLAAAGCDSIVSGASTDSTSGLAERWIVQRLRNGVGLIADSVQYLVRGVSHSIVLHRVVLC